VVKAHVEESLGANPGDAALNPADSVAMGVPSAKAPRFLDSSRGRPFRALRHPAFRLLFTAFLVNQTGFWVSHVSLQAMMASLSGSDPLLIGQLFFAMFIPAFLLAPIAGVVADRVDRKKILLVGYCAVAGVCAALAYFAATGAMTPHLLMGLSLLMGTCFSFLGPANMALAANAVSEEDLVSAVSLQSVLNNGTRVIGPALAAPLVLSGRFEIAFGVYCGATLIAAWLTWRMQVPALLLEDEEGGILARMRSGLQHAQDRRPAMAALFTVAWMSLFGVSHTALLPVFAERVLGDASVFAWIVAATGFGAMAGAFTVGYTSGPPTLRSACFYMLGFGISLAVFSQSTTLAVALGTQIAVGYFYFAVMTTLQTLLQQLVDESKRGRVMSLFQVAWAGVVPFGGLGMGAVASATGVVPTLLGGALCCTVFAIAMAASGSVAAERQASSLG
jgi:MFS family permease